jgi:hypothetical protein
VAGTRAMALIAPSASFAARRLEAVRLPLAMSSSSVPLRSASTIASRVGGILFSNTTKQGANEVPSCVVAVTEDAVNNGGDELG